MAESATREASINDYIEDHKNLSISFDTLHLKEKVQFSEDSSGITEGLLLGESFVQKYKSDLDDIVIEKTFTPDELRKYMCNPWALSYDLYGSVEYWFLLLDLNHMYSAIEFTQKTINIYDATLPDIIDVILASEESLININASEINDSDGEDINDMNNSDDLEVDI